MNQSYERVSEAAELINECVDETYQIDLQSQLKRKEDILEVYTRLYWWAAVALVFSILQSLIKICKLVEICTFVYMDEH